MDINTVDQFSASVLENHAEVCADECCLSPAAAKNTTLKTRFFAGLKARGYGLTSNSVYVNAATRVEVVCPTQHTTTVYPADFVKGSGCGVCSGRSREAGETKFLAAIQERGFRGVGVYHNARTPVEVICPVGHTIKVNPHNFIRGSGCAQCAGRCPKTAGAKFIAKLTKWGYSLAPNSAYISSPTPLALVCPVGHAFTGLPKSFGRGVNPHCPECITKKAEVDLLSLPYRYKNDTIPPTLAKDKRATFTCTQNHTFVSTVARLMRNIESCPCCAGRDSQAREAQFIASVKARNYTLDSAFVYISATTPVTVTCSVGHRVITTPGRISKYGCRACSGKCPEIAKQEFHEQLRTRGYRLEPGSYYVGSNKKCKIRCPKNHVYSIAPVQFKTGKSCIKCMRNCSVDAANAFYAAVLSRQYKLAPDAVYTNKKTKVSLICPEGHYISMTPTNFMRDTRCGYCYPGGFNPGKPGILYYLKFNVGDGRSCYKIGITNRSVAARYGSRDGMYQILWEYQSAVGADLRKMETYIKREFAAMRCHDQPVRGISNAELFNENIIPNLDSLYVLINSRHSA